MALKERGNDGGIINSAHRSILLFPKPATAMAATALMIPAAALLAVMLLLFNPSGCDALASFKPLLTNQTNLVGGKYLIGEEDIETEFMMESHVSRMLAGTQNFQTSNTNNANRASSGDCGRPPRYDSCLGQKANTPRPGNCGTYNRENPC